MTPSQVCINIIDHIVTWTFFAVFLTHDSIWQMLTWLPMRKVKWLNHIGTFLPTWFFLPLQKLKTIITKPAKNPHTQANMCLLHISRYFHMYLLYSLSLANYKQMRNCNRLHWSLLFACFLSVDIRCDEFRVDLII